MGSAFWMITAFKLSPAQHVHFGYVLGGSVTVDQVFGEHHNLLNLTTKQGRNMALMYHIP